VRRIGWQTAATLFWCIWAVNVPAQTFTNLASFGGAVGCGPVSVSLVQGTDANLYGTAVEGGDQNHCIYGCGTVYKLTPGGTVTELYGFNATLDDGTGPTVGVSLATDGNFYGTTVYGGLNNLGTVFVVTPRGELQALYQSNSTSGIPNPLVQGADGQFYGTGGCDFYGHNCGTYDHGTVFKMTPGGDLTVLYNFNGTDGSGPSRLIQGTDGDFYGTASGGGANGYGMVFKITAGGTLTTLYSFTGSDGSGPFGGVMQAVDEFLNGDLYGTTSTGGAYGYGTVFRLAVGGALTTLHSFDVTDGSYPEGPLVQGTDGNFYGTTAVGGAYGNSGTVFEVTPQGTFTSLHSFDVTDGAYLYGSGLVQATDGSFYGVTGNGCGTVFSLAMGLDPFVKTLPHSGRLGAPIKILGTNLTGATSVSFNGTAALFTLVSSTEILATVPASATTGHVVVTTPSGTLLSGGPFIVTP
jgi:uncharacterized repeat protein (TIGR03803 family)